MDKAILEFRRTQFTEENVWPNVGCLHNTVACKRSVKIAKPHDAHRPLHQNNTPPYSPTNMALYFINKGRFYSPILGL